MRKLVLISILGIAAISSSAFADDFLASCKANPPDGTAPAGYGDWCVCMDKETAANAPVRALFSRAFKETAMEKRIAVTSAAPGSAAASSIAQKCGAPTQ